MRLSHHIGPSKDWKALWKKGVEKSKTYHHLTLEPRASVERQHILLVSITALRKLQDGSRVACHFAWTFS